ncbi:hypothetical protein LLG96_11435 [bacterium]|nr:hypothetical protein [bacterium]
MKAAAEVLIGVTVMFMLTGAAAAQLRQGVTGFERNDRNLKWQTTHSGDFDLSPKWGFNLQSLLSTELNMRTGSDVENRWKDDINNRAALNYAASDKISLGFMADENFNRDSMNSVGKSLMTVNYGGSLRYIPGESTKMSGAVEHTSDTRFGKDDSGTTFKGRLNYDDRPLRTNTNLHTFFDANVNKSRMARKNDRYSLSGALAYDYDFATVAMKVNDDRSTIGYYDVKKGEGGDSRSTIELRNQNDRNFELSLFRGDLNSYQDRTSFLINMKLGSGKTDDTANEDSLSISKFHNNLETSLRDFRVRAVKRIGNRISAGWEAGYTKDVKDVQLKIRSRTQTDVITKGDIGITFGKSDSLSVFGWIWRTRNDTPQGVSNDRDELKFESGAKYHRSFSDNFQTILDFRMLETHYVNIDISQSSQNKWMKTYLFSPSLVYVPASFLSIRHEVNVYANYIEYDYEIPQLPRSNITRRVSSETWTDVAVTEKTLLKIGLMVEENDYGNLNMKRDMIPVEEGIKRFCNLAVDYRFTDWMVVTPRYIYAIRKDWKKAGSAFNLYRREVDQTYGIDCCLFKNRSNDYEFMLSAKRIVRETQAFPPRIRNYITMTLRYGF